MTFALFGILIALCVIGYELSRIRQLLKESEE